MSKNRNVCAFVVCLFVLNHVPWTANNSNVHVFMFMFVFCIACVYVYVYLNRNLLSWKSWLKSKYENEIAAMKSVCFRHIAHTKPTKLDAKKIFFFDYAIRVVTTIIQNKLKKALRSILWISSSFFSFFHSFSMPFNLCVFFKTIRFLLLFTIMWWLRHTTPSFNTCFAIPLLYFCCSLSLYTKLNYNQKFAAKLLSPNYFIKLLTLKLASDELLSNIIFNRFFKQQHARTHSARDRRRKTRKRERERKFTTPYTSTSTSTRVPTTNHRRVNIEVESVVILLLFLRAFFCECGRKSLASYVYTKIHVCVCMRVCLSVFK